MNVVFLSEERRRCGVVCRFLRTKTAETDERRRSGAPAPEQDALERVQVRLVLADHVQ
jgi:hypothetical protein